jgi:UDP-glucose 4-epimerase
MALCLVTGGAGFIGSHLVEALLSRGHAVRVVDNLSTGRMANLDGVRGAIGFLRGDLADTEVAREAARGVELVFHQAALPSVNRSVEDPVATHHACATATLNVLVAAREAGVRRVVYAASSSAYGNSGKLPQRETDAPQPLSPYAAAKLAGEEYCAAFGHVYGLETVRLRYFNVFGPRQPPGSPYSGVIPLFIDALLHDRSPVIYGDGLQSRDFTFVGDVVQANLLAAEAPRVAGRVYNVACGRSTSLLEILDTLGRIVGSRVKPVHAGPRPGDIRHSRADIARAQAELGYCPCTDLGRDLGRCVEHFKEQSPAPRGAGRPPQERKPDLALPSGLGGP